MEQIRNIIVAKLRDIEEKEGVKILYAVESGSRGWGFDSRDSDYDVRFIYVRPMDWYLSIEDRRDVIEYPVSDQLDISGWDIKKALKLFENSNPPLYEWLTSPIIYLEQEGFAQKLRVLMFKFYSPVAAIHHYLHMAQGNYRAYLTKRKIKIKKYFYVLRPILACMWIKEEKSMPPMEFEKLFSAQNLTQKVTNEIKELLKRKKLGLELNAEDKVEAIIDFLEEKLDFFENYVNKLVPKKSPKDDSLDKLFKDMMDPGICAVPLD